MAKGGEGIRHIAFIGGVDDVVLPLAELCLGQRVLVLAVQGQQHQLAVDIIAVQPRRGPPDDGAALGGGQVLHGVEAEAGKVSRFAAAQAAAASAEAVRRVGKHDRPAVERLQIVGGTEAPGGAPHRFKNAVVVAHAAAHVDRNHGLGALVDIPVQLVIVHLQAAGRNVRKDNFRADMRGDGGRRGIGVGAGDHFVARPTPSRRRVSSSAAVAELRQAAPAAPV